MADLSNSFFQPALNNPNFSSDGLVGTASDPTYKIAKDIEAMTTVKKIMVPLDMPKYFMSFIVSNYKRENLNSVPLYSTEALAQIFLPIPMGLVDNHTVDFSIDGIADVIAKPISATPNIIQSSRGIAPNRFLTVFFQGPKFKRYQLHWRFSPKSAKEAEAIRQLLRLLNNAMAPGLSQTNLYFTYPQVFQPAIFPNPKYMYRFKPAVLESLSANYTPAGQASFMRQSPETSNINAPEGIELSLQFLELEYWLTDDFKDTNLPYDTRGNQTNESKGLPQWILDLIREFDLGPSGDPTGPGGAG